MSKRVMRKGEIAESPAISPKEAPQIQDSVGLWERPQEGPLVFLEKPKEDSLEAFARWAKARLSPKKKWGDEGASTTRKGLRNNPFLVVLIWGTSVSEHSFEDARGAWKCARHARKRGMTAVFVQTPTGVCFDAYGVQIPLGNLGSEMPNYRRAAQQQQQHCSKEKGSVVVGIQYDGQEVILGRACSKEQAIKTSKPAIEAGNAYKAIWLGQIVLTRGALLKAMAPPPSDPVVEVYNRRGPVCKRMGSRGGKWYPRAKNSVAKFSTG